MSEERANGDNLHCIVGQEEDHGTRCEWCDKRSLASPCRECRIKQDLELLAADEYEEYGDDPM